MNNNGLTYYPHYNAFDIFRGVTQKPGLGTERDNLRISTNTMQDAKWPTSFEGCTFSLEIRIRGITATAGTGTAGGSGNGRYVDFEVLATAFDDSRIPDGTGTYRATCTDGEGVTSLLAIGVVNLYPNHTPPA